MKTASGLQFAKALEHKGWKLDRINGSHHIYKDSGGATTVSVPVLVAMRNTFDADGKASGGYVYFIQWNGESYDEVWKSNRSDDSIVDMQVCNPKGEGKPGLVILSADKKGCYLTKIVHVN